MGADHAFAPVVGLQTKWWQHQQPVPQEMGTQPGLPLNPCGNEHAQPHSLQCCVPKCCFSCFSSWLLASGHGGHAVVFWTSGAALLGNSARSPPRKSWKGLALEKFLALFLLSFQFLAAWGPGTPWTTRWEATVQEVEN